VVGCDTEETKWTTGGTRPHGAKHTAGTEADKEDDDTHAARDSQEDIVSVRAKMD